MVKEVYYKRNVSGGDYQQTKGIRSEQKIPTGKIRGFRKFDKVKYSEKEYFVKGRMGSGYAILMDIDGKKADFSNMPKGSYTKPLVLKSGLSRFYAPLRALFKRNVI